MKHRFNRNESEGNSVRSTKLLIAFLISCLAWHGQVLADRGQRHPHPRPGIVINPFWAYGWGPWYPPHYYQPFDRQSCPEQLPPPVFLEQEDGSPAESAPTTPAQTAYWYYCEPQRAYFPYVQECPGGWRKVLPHPPANPD